MFVLVSAKSIFMIGILLFVSLGYVRVVEAGNLPDGIYFIRPESAAKETLDFRPEFLLDEHMTFFSCIEGSPQVDNSVYCKDDPTSIVELETHEWKGSCHISTYNTTELQCSEKVAMAEYQEGDEILRWEEDVVVREVESIPYVLLDTQGSDGGWEDPVSTAWVIWALAEFGDGNYDESAYASQVEDGLRWLKENRHPSDNCWPEEECNIRTTAEVLSMMNEANLTGRTDWLRIVHDGSVWLSLQQNLFNLRDPTEGDIAEETWTTRITGENWTDGSVSTDYSSCLVDYADEYDETFQIVFDETYEFDFTPIHDESFTVLCSPNRLPIEIRNDRNQIMHNSTTGNVSYTIPGACWSDNEPWNHCDIRTTNYASTVALDSIREDLAVDWLNEELEGDDIGYYLDTEDRYFDTAWFLYQRYADDSDDADDEDILSDVETRIVRWLLFHQNNDGSWGNESADFDTKLAPTSMASMALTKVNNGSYTEYIKDSNVWISENRPSEGWDTVRNDALASLAFSRSAKPFMVARDGIIIMEQDSKRVELYNPSSFDFNRLEFHLEGDVEEYVSIDGIGSLASDYFKFITLNMNETPDEPVYGNISMRNDGEEVGKTPLLIRQMPEIDISPSRREYSVYNGQGTAEFDVDISDGASMDCRLFWDDPTITSSERFSISDQDSLSTDIVLSEVTNQEESYTGRFDCIFDGINQSNEFELNTIQFERTPFTVEPDSLNMTSPEDELSFTIYNNVDMDIVVNSEFENDDPYMVINDPQVQIPAHDRTEVTIDNFFDDGEEDDLNGDDEPIVWQNVIRVHAYDTEERVSVGVDMDDMRSFSFMGLFFTFTLVFGVIAGAGYFAYSNKSTVISMLPDSIKSRLPDAAGASTPSSGSADGGSGHPLEKKVNAKNFVHVAELIKIMKGLGKDDDEISKKLETEGFSNAEIGELFNRVQDEMDSEQSLEKEDRFMKLMKDLDSDVGAVKNKLKQDGFTDTEIKEAFKQAEEDILKKKTELDNKLKDNSKYDMSQEEGDEKGKEGKKEEKKEEEGNEQ